MEETRTHRAFRLMASALVTCMIALTANAFAPQGARIADNAIADTGANQTAQVQTYDADATK